MKQYNINFEATKPTQQTFYVPPYSQFQMGVRVDKLGVKQSDISVLKGSTLLSSSGTYNDFYVYDVNSGAPGAVAYTVKMLSSEQPFNILQVVTDSTVYDRNVGGGGGGGGDFDPTKYYEKSETSSATELNTKFGDYYKKTETSSATEIGTALGNVYTKSETSSATALQTAFGGVDLSVASLDTSAQTNTNDISAISAFTNEVGPILSGDGEQTFGLVGQVDNLTGDVSMLQSTVNEMYGDVQSLTGDVYNGDSTDRCAKVITDANCSADGMGSWTQGVTALQQISQAEYDALVNQMETNPHTLYIIAGSI